MRARGIRAKSESPPRRRVQSSWRPCRSIPAPDASANPVTSAQSTLLRLLADDASRCHALLWQNADASAHEDTQCEAGRSRGRLLAASGRPTSPTSRRLMFTRQRVTALSGQDTRSEFPPARGTHAKGRWTAAHAEDHQQREGWCGREGLLRASEWAGLTLRPNKAQTSESRSLRSAAGPTAADQAEIETAATKFVPRATRPVQG